ncbi:MAG: hypothetical protein IE917_19235 [Betaproteobacteria bacterium]|nr:hypothetical protein [Paracoccaceae bacterium]MBD3814312.1 hypothetical protein [Betaproteobacteria bacterium]
MKTRDMRNAKLVDLGKATVETKGTAVFSIDTSSGQLRYMTGATAE